MPPKRRSYEHEASSSQQRRLALTGAASRATNFQRQTEPPHRPSNPPPQPPQLPWEFKNEEQREKYNALGARPVACTRYIDEDALVDIELDEEVTRYLANIGWTKLASFKFHTYPEITLEFLSSFSCELHPCIPDDQGKIRFRLMGVDYELNMATFSGIFGLPNEGHRMIPKNFNLDDVWRELTHTPLYKPSCSKSTHLRNPALRYLHRFMAHSIFGRGDSTGVVNRNELFMMWAMMTKTAVNTGFWICTHFSHVARSTSGKICVGGLISVIADHFGFVPNSRRFPHVGGNERIDAETMVLIGMCNKEAGKYYLRDENGNSIPKRRGVRGNEDERRDPARDQMDEGAEPVQKVEALSPATNLPVPPPASGTVTLEMIMARLDQIEDRLQHSFGSMQSTYDQLNARLGRLEDDVDERLATIETKLDELHLRR